MLKSITDLYLTSYVLILLDQSYNSRFWTLMESWCAMQKADAKGLRTAEPGEERYTITCIHNATQGTKDDLIEVLSRSNAKGMKRMLEKPDVQVTNAKDKMNMLPVIENTDKHVMKMMKKFDSKLSNVERNIKSHLVKHVKTEVK